MIDPIEIADSEAKFGRTFVCSRYLDQSDRLAMYDWIEQTFGDYETQFMGLGLNELLPFAECKTSARENDPGFAVSSAFMVENEEIAAIFKLKWG